MIGTSVPARSRGARGSRTSARGGRSQPRARNGGRNRPRSRYQPRRSGRGGRSGGFYWPWLIGAVAVIVVGALGVVLFPYIRGLFHPARLSAECGVVIDASGSGNNFNPAARTNSKLPTFLMDQKCGYLDFIPLNGLSDASHCKEDRLNLDPVAAGPQEQTRASMRNQASYLAGQLLKCAVGESRSSDVLGAFREVAELRAPGRPYKVLVVSDMVQSTSESHLGESTIGTPAARQQLISQLKPVTPDLTGVTLYPTDLASTVADAKLRVDIQSFWTELFATDHAEMRTTYV